MPAPAGRAGRRRNWRGNAPRAAVPPPAAHRAPPRRAGGPRTGRKGPIARSRFQSGPPSRRVHRSRRGSHRLARPSSCRNRVPDHYHPGPEPWIIDLMIDTAANRLYSPQSPVSRWRAGHMRPRGGRGCRMAAMKPRTGDGPLEVTKEGRGIVMRVPLEGGGRLVVELSADEAAQLSDALKSATG